jgi:hypothetical protein
MDYIRDRATMHGISVFVGTQLSLKEDSAHAKELRENGGMIDAVIIGIAGKNITWIADNNKVRIGTCYTIRQMEDHFTVITDVARDRRNIATLELFEKFDGQFHGPRIETATIPLYKLFELVEHLQK